MWNILTVPTVWYFNCSRQCVMFLLFLQFGILTVTDNVEYILTVPTVWYFKCPRQCGMFLLYRQCGILTVPDNVECSYCSESVVI
jgi:hypothetical protein